MECKGGYKSSMASPSPSPQSRGKLMASPSPSHSVKLMASPSPSHSTKSDGKSKSKSFDGKSKSKYKSFNEIMTMVDMTELFTKCMIIFVQ